MGNNNQVDGLITEFGKIIGIPELVLDEENTCTLAFDDQAVNIQFSEEQNALIIFSDLGKVTGSNAEQLYKQLLTANFYREKLSNAAFSYCKETGSIVLMLHQSIEGLEIRQFDDLMENFTNLAIAWTLQIKQDQDQDQEKGQKTVEDNGNQNNWISV